MITCRQCSKTFPNYIEIEGLIRNVKGRKLCLECSPFNKSRGKVVRTDVCKECNLEKTSVNNTNLCQGCRARLKRRDIKQTLVNYKGGKCVNCGYNKCLASLDFHHIDPKEKDFSIAGNHCLTIEKLKAEVDKCILVCKNCHAEIHNE
jgi:hypothetical protein